MAMARRPAILRGLGPQVCHCLEAHRIAHSNTQFFYPIWAGTRRRVDDYLRARGKETPAVEVSLKRGIDLVPLHGQRQRMIFVSPLGT